MALNNSKTYFPSLMHDFMYEYGFIGRDKTDLLFYKNLKSEGFRLSLLYYIAVRAFG